MDAVKNRAAARGQAPNSRLSQLTIPFLAWKLLLLVVAATSPGPGYDTSTEILFYQYDSTPPSSSGAGAITHVVLRLTRWDGIYFATLAERGHVNEQEWAFSWALARVTSFIARVLPPSQLSPIVKHALVGVLISHLSHFVAVVLLYKITYKLVPGNKARIAFTAACLHIISPAGLFLSAPFSESTFALLNFAGTFAYIKARHSTLSPLWTVTAGVSFGAAAMIRGNGLLSGVLFAWDAVEALFDPLRLFKDVKLLSAFLATGLAGLLVGAGFAGPQVVAYVQYCTNGNTRPWCEKIPPSIYNWVQSHYWEVGFLKYWTLNNLPLFLLAGPMIVILILTGIIAIFRSQQVASACTFDTSQEQHQSKGRPEDGDKNLMQPMLPRLALPQVVLAIMAATSFHVQIINRISSGYPIWYILLAIAIQSERSPNPTHVESRAKKSAGSASSGDKTIRRDADKTIVDRTWHFGLLQGRILQWIVRGMVMYAIVQGGLYASFLPPA